MYAVGSAFPQATAGWDRGGEQRPFEPTETPPSEGVHVFHYADGQTMTVVVFEDGSTRDVFVEKDTNRTYYNGSTGKVYVDVDPSEENVPAQAPVQSGPDVAPTLELWGGLPSSGGPIFSFTDIQQEQSPTCAFASVLSALSRSYFDLASGIKLHRYIDDDTALYGVRMYRNVSGTYRTHWVYVEFDGHIKPDDLQSTTPGEYWMTIYQKGYLAFMSEEHQAFDSYPNAFLALTGLLPNQFAPEGDARTRANAILSNLNQGIPMVAGTNDPPANAPAGPYMFGNTGIIANHGYTIVGIEVPASGTAGIYVTLRNPWARDTTWTYFDADHDGDLSDAELSAKARGMDGNDDGLIRIPWSHFSANFRTIVAGWQIKGPPSNRPLPAPPIFNQPNPGPFSVRAGDGIVSVDCSAVAPNGQPLTYYLAEESAGGSVHPETGRFTWTPALMGSHEIVVIAENWNSLTSAAIRFRVDVSNGSPIIASLSSSPGTIKDDGSDQLTLTANGVATPSGVVDHVKFYRDSNRNGYLDSEDVFLGRDDSSAGGWTWSGYVGGMRAGAERFFAEAIRYTFSDTFTSDAAFKDVTVTAVPYVPPGAVAVGGQSQASPTSTDKQYGVAIRSDSDGNTYVFWNILTGTNTGAYLRKFDASGIGDNPVKLVSSPISDAVVTPSGTIAVVYGGLTVRWFSSSGSAINGGAFSVATTGTASGARLATDENGNLLIVYYSGEYMAEDCYAVPVSFAKTIGTTTRLNSYTTGQQKHPTVALNNAGNGVVAWTDADQGKVFYRLVSDYGRTIGSIQTASQTGGGTAMYDMPMDAAVNNSGVFVLAWINLVSGNGGDVLARRFAANGSPLGNQFVVHNPSSTNQSGPHVAINDLGYSSIVWNSFGEDGGNPSYDGVFAQMYDPSGLEAGSQFMINTIVNYDQKNIGVIIDADGDTNYGWNHGGFDYPSNDIVYWRRFRTNVAPTFASSPTLIAYEDAAIGSQVQSAVTATDLDGDALTYSILEPSQFTIDASGRIKVASALDYESSHVYKLTIKATDNGSPVLSGTTTVTILVRDVNEAPKIQNATFTAKEWMANGIMLGPMIAVDRDANDAITYSIVGDTPFSIDPTNGLIWVRDRRLLDFETKPTWTVNVKATDKAGLSATGIATINLTNADDYAVMRAEYGFKAGSSYFTNSYGFQEKWFVDRSNLWYVILPGGVIRKADAGAKLDQGTLVGTIGAAAYADPTLFFNATATLPQSTQISLTQLRTDYGFRLQGSLWTNSSGYKEKWFTDRSGVWHVILPTGEIRKADSANLFNGTFVAQVDPLVYDDPNALFNAPVTLSSAMNTLLTQLRKDNGFFINGSDWLNSSGYREKWLMDRAGAWYVLLPNGELRKVDNARLDQGTLKATLDPLVYDDVTKLTKAPVSLTTAQTDALSLLRKDNGFRSTGNFSLNAYGYREKWIQDRSGLWFVLLPNGDLRKVDAGANLKNGTLKATVDPLVYDDPTLLLNAAVALTQTAKDQLSQLRKDYGLFVNGSDWFNSSGYQERWLQDRSGKWYVLLPNGELRQANAGANLRNGTLLAAIDVLAYDDVKLLTAAAVTLPTSTQTTIAQLKIDYGFQLKGSLYFNSYGYREKWFADRTGVWYVILTNGQIRKVDAGGNLTVGTLKATVDPLVWDDPSVLFA
jgi:hypothetical protein